MSWLAVAYGSAEWPAERPSLAGTRVRMVGARVLGRSDGQPEVPDGRETMQKRLPVARRA